MSSLYVDFPLAPDFNVRAEERIAEFVRNEAAKYSKRMNSTEVVALRERGKAEGWPVGVASDIVQAVLWEYPQTPDGLPFSRMGGKAQVF